MQRNGPAARAGHTLRAERTGPTHRGRKDEALLAPGGAPQVAGRLLARTAAGPRPQVELKGRLGKAPLIRPRRYLRDQDPPRVSEGLASRPIAIRTVAIRLPARTAGRLLPLLHERQRPRGIGRVTRL